MGGDAPILRALDALPRAKALPGGGWRACCPAHEDRDPSLGWQLGDDDRVLLICRAGCTTEAVVEAMGFRMSDLYRPTVHAPASVTVATVRTCDHLVRDATGELVATHRRHELADGGKRFVWIGRDGGMGLRGVSTSDLPLYGSELVRAWPPEATIVITEGEKAADALLAIGSQALGTVTGAATAPGPAACQVLRARNVLLWPDADEPGRKHMRTVAERLARVASSVRWLEPPTDVASGWDAADAFADGRDPADVKAEIAGWIRPVPDLVPPGPAGVWADRPRLRFQTAKEFAQATPEVVEWLVDELVAVGAMTEVTAPIKTGKTEFLMRAVRAIVDGRPFLSRQTQRTAAVYCTEQPPSSLRAALGRADLLERDDMAILTWSSTTGVDWPVVVKGAVEECERRGARLLVIDTLSRFASLRGTSENDAGAADEAMAPLQQAAAEHGLAIVVARHERKGGGPVEEAGRGSSAFGGAADILLNLRRPEGNQRRTVRMLRGLSRFDSVPDELMIELTDEGYVALGDRAALVAAETRAALLECLPSDPDLAIGIDRLMEVAEAPRTTTQRELTTLVAEERVARIGKGRSGSPFRYHLVTTDESLSAHPKAASLGGQTLAGTGTPTGTAAESLESRSAQAAALDGADRHVATPLDLVEAARSIFGEDLEGAST
ncbi:hypothetical protein BH24CHL6_BH24CHL6_09320 [soil metagenome]